MRADAGTSSVDLCPLARSAAIGAPAIVLAGGALASIEEAGRIIAFILGAGAIVVCGLVRGLGRALEPSLWPAGEVRQRRSDFDGRGLRRRRCSGAATSWPNKYWRNLCQPKRKRMPIPLERTNAMRPLSLPYVISPEMLSFQTGCGGERRVRLSAQLPGLASFGDPRCLDRPSRKQCSDSGGFPLAVPDPGRGLCALTRFLGRDRQEWMGPLCSRSLRGEAA